MRKSRHSQEQIIGILRGHETGASITDLSRRRGGQSAGRSSVGSSRPAGCPEVPSRRRGAPASVLFGLGTLCRSAVGTSCSMVRYQPRRNDDAGLVARLGELALQRPRFGYQRLHALLHREGEIVQPRDECRLYPAAGLVVLRR